MDEASPTPSAGHVPVLLEEVMSHLSPQPGETVVDATLGLGGHARVMGQAIGEGGLLIGVDADPASLAVVRERLADLPCRCEFIHENFAVLPDVLNGLGVDGADVLLADLGVASTHLDEADRGFSFRQDGPLDMRLDPRIHETAADLVNRLPERELADTLYQNAEERASRRIARTIVSARRHKRITRTSELADIVCRALNVDPQARRSKIHPATKTFQALRIAVNDELGALQSFLEHGPAVLRSGGRIGVISFHSLEDRAVKLDFRRHRAEGTYVVAVKKPIVANVQEKRRNPRARSAKLRVAEKVTE